MILLLAGLGGRFFGSRGFGILPMRGHVSFARLSPRPSVFRASHDEYEYTYERGVAVERPIMKRPEERPSPFVTCWAREFKRTTDVSVQDFLQHKQRRR